jgi:excisionase family DNA binding protein
VPTLPADEWITVSEAARVLGLMPHTVYDLIDRGDLGAEVIVPTDRPKRRRSIRLRRREVDEFIERARVKPGELAHLYPDWPGTRYR